MIKKKNTIFSISNLISIFRGLLSIPIFLSLKNDLIVFSLLLIIIAIITDWLDGFVARILKENSELGKILDPLCDFFVVSSIILFLLIDENKNFPFWFLIFYLTRQITISLSFFYSLRKFNRYNGSNAFGKWTIFLISISLFLYILNYINYGYYFLSASIFFATISWFYYLKNNLRQ